MMELLVAANILFFVAALFGLHFVYSILKKKNSPKISPFIYSILNASAITIMVFIILNVEDTVLEVFVVLFTVLFIIGIYLIYKYILKEKVPSKKTVKLHPIIDFLVIITLFLYISFIL